MNFIEGDIEQNLKSQDEKEAAELAQLKKIEVLTSELSRVRREATAEDQDVEAVRASRDVAQLELAATRSELVQLRSELRINQQATPAFQAISLAGLVTEDAFVRDADLRGRSIKNVSRISFDLTEIDLAGAILDRVNLRDSTLVGANFEGAVLRDVDLRRGNLFKANFRNAKFTTIVALMDANLREADFTGAEFSPGEVSINDADLRGAIGLTCQQLTVAHWWETAFRDAGLACGGSMPSTK